MNVARLASALVLAASSQGCLTDDGPVDMADPGSCSEPAVACGADCVDPENDPAHCGGCGRSCETSEVCSTGECAAACPGESSACNGSCRDFMTDSAHCGGCDQPCAEEFACVEGACVAVDGAPSGDRRIRVAGTQFVLCGRPIFMNGANTPWQRWNDFGGGYDEAWWSEHYADLHDVGVNSSRVWITCSGEVGIDITADGEVLGATDAHWEHLDSFFATAEEREIYVMATLMSFDHFRAGAEARWKAWIESDANIDAYVDRYLVPFLARYSRNPYLWSIDLMNEPDWAYERSGVSFDRLRAYFARAARAIHERSDVLVTIGTGMPKYAASCVGCEPQIGDSRLREAVDDADVYLDFYSPHYYDWIADTWGNTLYQSPEDASFPSDRPLMFGEHPARGTEGHTLLEDLESALGLGWRGTMPWTSNGVDGNGGFAEVSAAASAFRNAHPALVFPPCP